MSIPTGIVSRFKALAIALAGASLVACGGGGGGGDGGNNNGGTVTPQDTTPPSVTVVSPKYSSATTNRYLEVTGTASDNDSGVASISVNGVAAATADAYRNWSVTVPLNSSLTQLKILANDSEGNQRKLDYAVRINRISDQLAEPSALGIDPESGLLLVTDRKLKKLFKFDLSAPNPSSVPINDEGHDVEFNFPEGFFWSSQRDRLLFIDFASSSIEFEQSLFAINADTGALAEPVELAALDDPFRFYDITGLPAGQSVYLLSATGTSTSSVVREFDLGSGTLSEVGRTTTHSNPDYSLPNCLAISENGQRLYFIDNGALMSMDIRSGTMSTLSPRSNTPSLVTPVDLVVNNAAGKAWVVDSAQAAVIAIDLTNGSRRMLSNTSNGDGPAFELPGSMVFDQPRNRLLVADTGLNMVYSVAIDSGNREYFISNRQGLGPTLSEPGFVRLSPDSQTAYVTDTKLEAIVAIDVATGVRTVVSANTEDSTEVALAEPANLAIDDTGAALWVSNLGSGTILQVDTQTGQRSAIIPSYAEGARVLQKPVGIEYDARSRSLLVSDIFNDSAQTLTLSSATVAMTGSSLMNDGSELVKPVAVAHNATTNKVYALDNVRNGLVEWAPANGGAKLLSTLFVGQGIDFMLPVDLQINETARRAYVSDEILNTIIEVNLDTGDREVLSGMNQGSGPAFKQITGLDYNPQTRTLVAVDKADRSVYAIDLDNGNRRVLSR